MKTITKLSVEFTPPNDCSVYISYSNGDFRSATVPADIVEKTLNAMLDTNKLVPLPDPDISEHMTMEDFIKSVESGMLIDYDGFAHYATDKHMTEDVVVPSDVSKGKIDKSFTHVVWFNR